MGYAVSWLAAKSADSGALLQNLGLTPTGETTGYGDALFTGRSLQSGWFVLFINQCHHVFVQRGTLASISAIVDVVACSIEEHVMWSTAGFWHSSCEVWRVEHDAQEGICHLRKSGSLPDEYSRIETQYAEEQKQAAGKHPEVDYFFEIPLQLAKKIVGFKHDESPAADEDFMVLERTKPRYSADATVEQNKKPWWNPW